MRKVLREPETARAAAIHDFDGDAVRQAVLAPNGKPIFTLDQVIQQLTAINQAWDGAPGHPTPRAGVGTITYAFFNSPFEVYSSEQSEFSPLTEAQRVAVRDAFAIWGEFVGVTFVEGTPATADINIGNIDPDEDYYSAYANYPGFSLVAGDIWIRSDVPTNMVNIGLAEPGFRTLLHEIGHALGISHPGDYNAEEGVTLTYAQHAEYYQDSLEYTIMSYFASSSTGATRTSFAATPLAHDIAAIQSLYGVNMTTRTGDTIYGFNTNAGRAAFDFTQNTLPVIAIWDAGGVDTLDFSGWNSPSRIDLRPGAMNDGGGQTSNVQIAFGTTIENATAGAGDDSVALGREEDAARQGRRFRLGHRQDRLERHRRGRGDGGERRLRLDRRGRVHRRRRATARRNDRRPGPYPRRHRRRCPRRSLHHRQRHGDRGQRLRFLAALRQGSGSELVRQLYRHRRRFPAADAERRDPALAAGSLQR
jgi:hypothetical protein